MDAFGKFIKIAESRGWRLQRQASDGAATVRRLPCWTLRRYPVTLAIFPEELDASNDQNPEILNMNEPGPEDLTTIMGIIVAERWRRKGIGTKTMHELVSMAELAEARLEVIATPLEGEHEEPGLTAEILAGWLEKCGFEHGGYGGHKMVRD